MKNLFKAFLLCLMAVAALACGPDPVTCEVCGKEPCECETPGPEVCEKCGKEPCECETPAPALPTFNVELKTAETDFVEVSVSASAELEIAYLLSTEASDPAAAVLFVTGTTAKVKDGDVIKITEGVAAGTNYWFYAVAKLDDKNFSEVYKIELRTKDYEFTETLTVVETYYDGYKVHVSVPNEVKQRDNALRYSFGSLALYNVRVANSGNDVNFVDAESIVFNGNPYGNYIKKDTTIVHNNDNVYLKDENGEIVYDGGDPVELHSYITPGEPTIFLAGECRMGEFDELHKIMGMSFGTNDSSYIIPLIDDNFNWTGEFQKKTFFAKAPELCEGTVEIDIPEDEISAVDANIYFTMDDKAYGYVYLILDDPVYNELVNTYFAGDESWFQWYLTSYIAMYEWGLGMRTEDYSVNAASSFIEPLTADSKYHVVCTVRDKEGIGQRYIHKEFRTKEKTKSRPVLEVSAVETGDPYAATFNIKSTNPESPLVGGYWACNYTRDFQLMFNSGYTYETLLKGNYSFTSDEIAKINSPEGLTVSGFTTVDGETLRFAAYGFNDEYTFNRIDQDTEGAGWADYLAPWAPPVDMVDSPYYEALEGEWTATATLSVLKDMGDGTVAPEDIQYKAKVTIGNGIPGIPDQVEEHVYGLYKGKSPEEVDGMFEELLMLADEFAEYRLLGQNRMLCSGFMDYDYYSTSRMKFMSPYDLFKAEDYSSVDVPQLLYDFGPKWYLEAREDGSLIAPFNSNKLPPMHSWPGYEFYLGAVGNGTAFLDASEEIPGFPVEVSDDYNTLTIKPIVITEDLKDANGQIYVTKGTYYMNSVGINNGSLELISTVKSDIVLTRGWTEGNDASKSSYRSVPSKINGRTIDGRPVSEIAKNYVYKSITSFDKVKPLRTFKVDENPNVLTKDMLDKTTQKILNYEINY